MLNKDNIDQLEGCLRDKKPVDSFFEAVVPIIEGFVTQKKIRASQVIHALDKFMTRLDNKNNTHYRRFRTCFKTEAAVHAWRRLGFADEMEKILKTTFSKTTSSSGPSVPSMYGPMSSGQGYPGAKRTSGMTPYKAPATKPIESRTMKFSLQMENKQTSTRTLTVENVGNSFDAKSVQRLLLGGNEEQTPRPPMHTIHDLFKQTEKKSRLHLLEDVPRPAGKNLTKHGDARQHVRVSSLDDAEEMLPGYQHHSSSDEREDARPPVKASSTLALGKRPRADSSGRRSRSRSRSGSPEKHKTSRSEKRSKARSRSRSASSERDRRRSVSSERSKSRSPSSERSKSRSASGSPVPPKSRSPTPATPEPAAKSRDPLEVQIAKRQQRLDGYKEQYKLWKQGKHVDQDVLDIVREQIITEAKILKDLQNKLDEENAVLNLDEFDKPSKKHASASASGSGKTIADGAPASGSTSPKPAPAPASGSARPKTAPAPASGGSGPKPASVPASGDGKLVPDGAPADVPAPCASAKEHGKPPAPREKAPAPASRKRTRVADEAPADDADHEQLGGGPAPGAHEAEKPASPTATDPRPESADFTGFMPSEVLSKSLKLTKPRYGIKHGV